MNVVLLLFTTWLIASRPLLRERWIIGAGFTAIFQLFPIVHIPLGGLALQLLVRCGLVKPLAFGFGHEPLMYESIDFLPACLLTLMVGGGLLGVAFLVGKWQLSRAEEDQLVAADRDDV
jgi:hypothetical protein